MLSSCICLAAVGALNNFVFHYTTTAVELDSGNDESYFANHQQMAYYCIKYDSALKMVKFQTRMGICLSTWIVLRQLVSHHANNREH